MYRIYYLVVVIVFSLFTCSTSLLAVQFELQNKVTKKRVNFFFPKNTITGINNINCAFLDKAIRPKGWPDRIPFGAGISIDRKRVHYLLYNSFFKRSVKDIENKQFNYLNDLCITKKGRIFILDSKEEKIFYFDLNK